MRYNTTLEEDRTVVYQDSPTTGFTCVNVEATSEKNVYSVMYTKFTEGFNYILYTTRCNRPAFVEVNGLNHLLHVNDKGGWHLSPRPYEVST